MTTEPNNPNNTPPADPPADPAPVPPSEGGEKGADWMQGVESDDLRDYVKRVGFKDLSAALQHGREQEKMLGVPRDRLIKRPEKSFEDDPEAYRDIQKLLGLPDGDDAVKQYELPEVEGVFAFKDDAERAEMAKKFHDLGIAPRQAKALIEDMYVPVLKDIAEAQALAAETAVSEAEAALKKEWGAAYEDNLEVAKNGELAMPEEFSTWLQAKGLNNDPMMIRLLHEVGSYREEGGAAPAGRQDGPGGPTRPLSPEQMNAELDEFEARYEEALNNRSHPEHKMRRDQQLAIIKRGTPRG